MADRLRKARKTVVTSVQRIHEFTEQFTEDGNTSKLIAKTCKLEDYWSRYNDIQAKIEDEAQDDDQENEDSRIEFENMFYEIKAVLEKFVNKKPNDSITSKVKLPQLHIPIFNGNYQEWSSFRDIFTSVIHQNQQISAIQKLYYLKASLKDEPLQIIQSITASTENYTVAWQLLCERYDNKQFIVNSHLKALFELPTVEKNSVVQLRKLITDTKQHLQSLETLKVPVNSWGAIIIFWLNQKLDTHSRREWELSKKTGELPDLKTFFTFLEQRCQALELISEQERSTPRSSRTSQRFTHVASSRDSNSSCIICKEGHNLFQCPKFIGYSVNERLDVVKSKGLCFNCLRKGHSVKQCQSISCKACNQRHHTLIHVDNKTDSQQSSQPSMTAESNVALYNADQNPQVLLSTAVVLVQDAGGHYHKCRALLDSASQSNFITTALISRLKLKTTPNKIQIKGVQCTSTQSNRSVNVRLASRVSQFNRQLEFLALDKITSLLPTQKFSIDNWKLPENIMLADPLFYEPQEVDILIGAEIFFHILQEGHYKLGQNLPIMQNTCFGWIISGKLWNDKTSQRNTYSFLSNIQSTVEDSLARFWQVEELSETSVLSQDEQFCEQHFTRNTARDASGRYTVTFPIRDKFMLGNSYNEAYLRFQMLEKRFTKNRELFQQYKDFLHEYLKLGHMEKLQNFQSAQGPVYYLPHHAVIKATNTTTKLRVVFDASMKSSNGKSLNDILLVGPTIQQDLFSIVLRFRFHNIVFSADIIKMYRQVKINESQTDMQRILWRDSKEKMISCYRLKTVTYGTASAPYLATRCLKQLALDDGENYPLAATVLQRDFYVDDVLSGASNLTEALELQRQLTALLALGGFELHKWCANHRDLLTPVSESKKEVQSTLITDDKETVKTLGLTWNPVEDQFMVVIPTEIQKVPLTKRSVLSTISKIFDPLGFLGPVVLRAKIFIQELWRQKLEWDQEIDSDLSTSWLAFSDELKLLKHFYIHRKVMHSTNTSNIQIHGFSDASERAYGACLYVRSIDTENNVCTRLLCSKSRVAPVKQISLPRLELCGALLLARLLHKALPIMNVNVDSIFLYTDSTIVLAWLNSPATRWKTFVAHRVSEIQEYTSKYQWNHIKSSDNPADVLSRGSTPSKLIETNIWWHGPNWLDKSESEWPRFKTTECEDIPELKKSKITTTCHVVEYELPILNRCSTFNKLQRIIAYCYRFIHNVKPNASKYYGPLSVDELQTSLMYLLKAAQREGFRSELQDLQANQDISTASKIKSLTPFLDEDGLIRVGGRLKNAQLPFSQQHPIILPPKHVITILLLQREHLRLLHGNAQTMLANIRLKYWPMNARNEIKGIIHKCITCFRFRASTLQQQMGDLPKKRVQPGRPFLNCGVDYGGPVFLRQNNKRNSTLIKGYIALFVCLSTKAIHIELVSSLSTESFLNAFQRFVSRRGKCATIISDNATNFKGAQNELHELYSLFKSNTNRIVESAANLGVKWSFIPPNAPHFGGLWEAGIKSAKYHLRRIVGKAHLTFEDFYTILTNIEAILNSRPLIPLSDDPNTLSYLSPAHFLIGESLTAIPEPDITNVPENRLSKYQRLQALRQHFWNRWSSEYLTTLQQRHKWNQSQPNIQIGSLVLIREENVPPLNWITARVTELHPGADGRVRVVTIRTASGLFKRPITKLCLIPIE